MQDSHLATSEISAKSNFITQKPVNAKRTFSNLLNICSNYIYLVKHSYRHSYRHILQSIHAHRYSINELFSLNVLKQIFEQIKYIYLPKILFHLPSQEENPCTRVRRIFTFSTPSFFFLLALVENFSTRK